jgi:UDP-N-acetylmuramyl pentapeptide synthase
VLSDLSALQGAARVVTIGEAYAHAPGPSWVERHVSIGDETIEEVARSIGPGDRVLLKGSRGVRLERLVERIRAAVHGKGGGA